MTTYNENVPILTTVRFANVLLAGLIAGTLFGIWLGYNPRSLSAPAYIEQQQNAIRALNVTMPVLGAICTVITLVHAYLARSNRSILLFLIAAAALFVIAGLVTRFGNQPINAIVITWRSSAPPPVWESARDRWWQWHIVRTVAMIAGFCCIIRATIIPRSNP
jgi:uncharacterized membrane protein